MGEAKLRKHILAEIQRIARECGGTAPGEALFKRLTAITRAQWYPDFWLRWSEARVEAGFAPGKFDNKHTKEVLLQMYVGFVKELGRVPVEGEIIRKRKHDKSFPNRQAFQRFGAKSALLEEVIRYCKLHDDLVTAAMVEQELAETNTRAIDQAPTSETVHGYVYLQQAGSKYRIGASNSPGRRVDEIDRASPDEVKCIWEIETDDMFNVEGYWHKRFEKKRVKRDWFKLSSADVSAFKRWKKIY
jgi:predicted Rdx family selenoprotein